MTKLTTFLFAVLTTTIALSNSTADSSVQMRTTSQSEFFNQANVLDVPMPDSIRTISTILLSDRMRVFEPAPQRAFYNHSFRFGTGYSLNTARLDASMKHYSDTSEHNFVVKNHTPIFSLSHTIALDSCFTLGYTLAYANSEIYFDNSYYGSQFFYLSLNPQLHVWRSFNFEYYVKLKVGVSYEKNELAMVPSERIQNIYPTGFHMFTGFTFAGINYLINDNLALNAELSIWSPESVNVGISYRFFKKRPNYTDVNMKYAY